MLIISIKCVLTFKKIILYKQCRKNLIFFFFVNDNAYLFFFWLNNKSQYNSFLSGWSLNVVKVLMRLGNTRQHADIYIVLELYHVLLSDKLICYSEYELTCANSFSL